MLKPEFPTGDTQCRVPRPARQVHRLWVGGNLQPGRAAVPKP